MEINYEIVQLFEETFSERNVFFHFLDSFPFMIAIFSPDGTCVYLNSKGFEEVKINDPSLVVGRYNILQDTVVLDTLGLRDSLVRVFKGERVIERNLRFPADRYNKTDSPFIKIVIQTVSSFPIYDDRQQMAYIAMVFVTTETFEGRKEIVKVLEYLNEHWLDEFDREKLAEVANMSIYHFTRVFKQHQGMSPLDHYKQIKLKKLCEKLIDPNYTITQAFAACGVDVKGRYMQYFKEEFGMTPSAYRSTAVRLSTDRQAEGISGH